MVFVKLHCRWIHDYQDACVDKLEQFINGEKPTKLVGLRGGLSKGNSLCSPTPELQGVHTPPVFTDNTPSSTTKLHASSRAPFMENGLTSAVDSAGTKSSSNAESI